MGRPLRDTAHRATRYLEASRPAASRPRPRRSRVSTSWAARCRRPERSGRRPGAARRDRLAGHRRQRRRPLLRLRDRRLAAGGAGRELARRRLGSERGPGRRAPRSARRSRRSRRLAPGRARAPGDRGRGLRHRRHHGELHRARRRAPRGAAAPGWDVERRRAVRRAADHRRRRRRGARQRAQGARPARARAATRVVRVPVDGQGRHARRRAAAARRADDRLHPGRQREHRRLRSRRAEICRARARGRRVGARRRRVRAVGRGGAAARAPRRRASTHADSWATDAHKWLNVPYDSGLAFVRDADALRAAMAVDAPRTCRAASRARNPSDYTPELSRRARGVEVWAALRSLGRAGLADLIERTCRHAPALRRRARARPATRS